MKLGAGSRWLGGVGAAAACALACWGLAGCATDPADGYAFASTFDTSERSVAVEIFENETFDHGLEFDLTEALVKQIRARTPWTVTEVSRADTTLTGVITDTDLRQVARRDATGLSQETAFTITVAFEWRDNRTGQRLVARTGFSAMATFAPSIPARERVEVGQHGAIDELAEGIVGELRSKW